MIRRLFFLVLAAIVLAAPPAVAQTFPPLTGRVVDNANLLDPATEQALTDKLAGLEQRTGRQLVVATLPSLEGRTIEDYGYRLGRTWAIGAKDRDDGVLLIVAPNERKVRIETGYGARVFLTDALSSVIVRNAILPRFRANDYPGGIVAGADAIIEQMELSPAEAQRRLREAEAQGAGARPRESAGFAFVFWFIVVLFIVLSFARKAGGRRHHGRRGRSRGGVDPWVILWGIDALSRASRGGGGWGGGGGGWGGGGGFSGGGGSFGGGGASGSW